MRIAVLVTLVAACSVSRDGGEAGTDATTDSALDAGVDAPFDAGVDADFGLPCGPGATPSCGAGFYCAGSVIGRECGGKDVFGFACAPRPSDCSAEPPHPVCGCDHVDYANACLAHAAGIDALDGRCPPGPPCTSTMPCTPGDSTECVGDGTCTGAFYCVGHMHLCATTLTPFCGCDGVTWFDRAGCERRPYAHAGECTPPPATSDCDPSHALCDSLPPDCTPFPDTAPSVSGGCWTRGCAPLTTCACTTDAACPDAAWRCDVALGVCRPR